MPKTSPGLKAGAGWLLKTRTRFESVHWGLDYQHLNCCESEFNTVTSTLGLPRRAKSNLALYLQPLKTNTYFLSLSFGRAAERSPAIKGSWPSRFWIQTWPRKNNFFCPRTQRSQMISEHSCAKPHLSPSQENPAEGSRKSLFKVEMGFSIYAPILKEHKFVPLAPRLTWAAKIRHLSF